MFLGFWGVFIGAIFVPELFPYGRIVVLTVAGITFIIAGIILTYQKKQKPYKPVTAEQVKREQTSNAIFIALEFFDGFVSFILFVVYSSFILLNDILLKIDLGYVNILLGILAISGVIFLADAIRRLWKIAKEKYT